MRTLYFECNMGAAGDMLAASLLELHPEPAKVIAALNNMGLPGVEFSAEASAKCGIAGTHFTVKVHGEEEESHDASLHTHDDGHHIHMHDHEEEHHHHHDHEEEHHHHHDHEEEHHHHHDHEEEHHHHHDHEEEHHHHHDHEEEHHHHDHEHEHAHHHHHVHRGMAEITAIIDSLKVPEEVKEHAKAVYMEIAEAESHAHGRTVEEVHFHEVGAMDAVADVTAVCLLIHELKPEQILASPVHTGCGEVRCAHGILPVPAPATAYILRDIPTYGGAVQGELCTPTGAALLRHFVSSFGNRPVMRVTKTGIGTGKKDFPYANIVRAMMGETEAQANSVLELSCNVDDMTAEEIGYAMERLFEAGALEVFTVPIGMKKSRPGILLTCMCREADGDKMTELLFRHTTTLGIREMVSRRRTLRRSIETKETEFGPVRVKRSEGWGVVKEKAEYDDLARIAAEKGISLREIRALIEERK